MDIERVSVELEYLSTDFDQLLDYVETHHVENGGRYELGGVIDYDDELSGDLIVLKIYSHPWSTRFLKAESMILCAYWISLEQSAIIEGFAAPKFDLGVTWAELAGVQERARARAGWLEFGMVDFGLRK